MGAFIRSCPFPIPKRGYASIDIDAAAAYGVCGYWAVVDLGYSLADLAILLGMTGQGVGYAVSRGARITKENDGSLKDCVNY